MPPVFDMEKCIVCGECANTCPGYCLKIEERAPHVEYPDECWHCGNCRTSCPVNAVTYKFPITMLV